MQMTVMEVQTNMLAAYVAAGLAAQLPALMTTLKLAPKASFEVAYNRWGSPRWGLRPWGGRR
jgi:hypothetical protein